MNEFRSRRVRVWFAVFLAVALTFGTTPAGACGCGIYLPSEGEASVSEEHVLIRWDGQTEDVVMTLGVLGSSKEAAVIFPVPTRATVQLADPKVFDALRELTKPLKKKTYDFFPMLAAGGATDGAPRGVTLLERQSLGPFDVSTLAATDVSALGDWLAENGYNLPPEVVTALEPYVAQHWYYVAVRLTPGSGADELTGALDPLWIAFPTDQIIYPMRPTALARESLTVYMYVLADHRVEKPMSFGYESVQYADWVEPAALEPDSPLAAFVTRKLFLTKIVEMIYQPETINSDYIFRYAASDETYRAVEYQHVSVFELIIPICLWTIVGVIVLLLLRKFLGKSSKQRAAG